MRIRGSIAALLTTFSCACATTTFVDSSGSATGFRWYDPKPYLLVKRAEVSGAVLESTVEILPDLERPQFVTQQAGLGSSKFKVATKNGVLTEFSQNTTDAGPATLNKLGDAFKAFAEHEFKTFKERQELRAANAPPTSEEVALEAAGVAEMVGRLDLFEWMQLEAAGGDPTPDPIPSLTAALKIAREALEVLAACLGRDCGEKPCDCDSERTAAQQAVAAAERQATIDSLRPDIDDRALEKRIVRIGEELRRILPGLAPRKPTDPKVEKLGEVAIRYELYEMVVCEGRVVDLVPVPPEQVCRIVSAACGGGAVDECLLPICVPK